MPEQYFAVGTIVGTHGIRGEVKVLSRTDFPERRFRKGSELHLRKPGEVPAQTLTVQSGRPHKNVWLVTFAGFENINLVESWRGMELCVAEEELMPLPEGTFYIHHLIGLEVYTDDGTYMGKLVDVLTPGANDVYVVRGPVQKQDILVPAIGDVVKDVDVDAGRMTIHLLRGMLAADEES